MDLTLVCACSFPHGVTWLECPYLGTFDVILVTCAKCLILIGSLKILLCSDWSVPSGAPMTTCRSSNFRQIETTTNQKPIDCEKEPFLVCDVPLCYSFPSLEPKLLISFIHLTFFMIESQRKSAIIYWRADISYIEDITRWREDMNFMFEPTCNVLFIIWKNQFNKSKRRESWRHWTMRHSQRWHTENTPLGSRMKWRIESTSGLVPSKTLSSI